MINPLHTFSFIKRTLSMTLLIDSFMTALFVGIVLNFINNGVTFYSDANTSWPSVLFNFAVPFFVATYSGLRASYLTCGLAPQTTGITNTNTNTKSTGN